MAEWDNGESVEEEFSTVTLVDDEGNEKDFVIVTVLPFEGAQYAIMEPVETLDADEAEIVAMKLGVDEEGDETLLPLEDDEYDRVFEAYLRHLDEEVEEDEADQEA